MFYRLSLGQLIEDEDISALKVFSQLGQLIEDNETLNNSHVESEYYK